MSNFDLSQYNLDQEVDMTEVVEAGGEREILPTGYYVGRLVRYLELGNQANDFDPSKAPAPNFRLEFVVFKKGEDKPHFLGTFDMTLSAFPKSNAKKAFDAMNYKGTAKHFAQFIGEAFLIPVKKAVSKKGKDVNNIELEKILPPYDAISGTPYPVPEVDDKTLGIFIFNQPSVETFNALPQFLQEKVINAKNYSGSAVEELINTGKGIELKQKKSSNDAPDGKAVTETKKAQVTETPVELPDPDEAPLDLDLPAIPELD